MSKHSHGSTMTQPEALHELLRLVKHHGVVQHELREEVRAFMATLQEQVDQLKAQTTAILENSTAVVGGLVAVEDLLKQANDQLAALNSQTPVDLQPVLDIQGQALALLTNARSGLPTTTDPNPAPVDPTAGP